MNSRFRELPGREDGFTLMEVLAALLIFSVSFLGLMRASVQSTRVASAIELKTLAGIVADNRLAVARRTPTSVIGGGGLSGPAAQSGESRQLGRDFDWRVERVDTPVDGLRELVVRVEHEGRVIATRRGFTTTPLVAVDLSGGAEGGGR